MINVFISLVNFNGAKDTLECLNSINDLVLKNIKLSVVVVDNASEEKLDIKEDLLKNSSLKVIQSYKNLGFSGGHNLAIKYAMENGADYIVVLNNDVILDKNLIAELIESSEKEGDIISPKIYFAKGFEFHKDRYKDSEKGKVLWYAGGEMDWNNLIGHHRGVDEVDSGQFDKKEQTDFASGCCMLVKKEVVEKIGYLDERYFLYYEDNDYSQRAKNKGFKIFYEPKAFLWHKNAGSVGGSGSTLQDYYITRNRLLFGMSYASLRTKIALFKESINFLLKGRAMQKKGVFDFYLRRFGKGSYK